MAAKKTAPLVYGASPRADLLPEAQRAERRHQQTMPKLLLAIVLSAVLAALIWAGGMVPVLLANQRLAALQTESSELIAQLAAHADVQQSLNAVSNLSAERKSLAAEEVLFVPLLDEIDGVLPGDVSIVRYTGQLVSATQTELGSDGMAVDLNPLCTAESATLTVEFFGPDLGPAPAFIRGLEGVTGFKCVAGTKIEVEVAGGPQKVTVQLALDADALAQRFEEAE